MTIEQAELTRFTWLNPPPAPEVDANVVQFVTRPGTDFWQRTHYGFRRNSGHAFLTRLWDDFSFSFQAEFVYESLFDQCGLILYLDEDNWTKASIEYSEDGPWLLGSVATRGGFSDWASSPLHTPLSRMFYRLSRRGADFRIDASDDGDTYQQMRIFHMDGDLTVARVGVYACSPGESSFRARFSELRVGASLWND